MKNIKTTYYTVVFITLSKVLCMVSSTLLKSMTAINCYSVEQVRSAYLTKLASVHIMS